MTTLHFIIWVRLPPTLVEFEPVDANRTAVKCEGVDLTINFSGMVFRQSLEHLEGAIRSSQRALCKRTACHKELIGVVAGIMAMHFRLLGDLIEYGYCFTIAIVPAA